MSGLPPGMTQERIDREDHPHCDTCRDTGFCEGQFTSSPVRGQPVDVWAHCPDCAPDHLRGQIIDRDLVPDYAQRKEG